MRSQSLKYPSIDVEARQLESLEISMLVMSPPWAIMQLYGLKILVSQSMIVLSLEALTRIFPNLFALTQVITLE